MEPDDSETKLPEVRLTREQERLTIYAKRLYMTMGSQAADAIYDAFGMTALLREKCLLDTHEEKMKAKAKKIIGDAAEENNPVAAILNSILGSDDDGDECQCVACRYRMDLTNNFRMALGMLRDHVIRDMSEMYLNTRPHNGPDMLVGVFCKAMAAGYVLGRDEKKITSGKYDDQLDKMDRLSALTELDKELAVSEMIMNADPDSREAALAFEERRDLIKIMRKYVTNGILSIKEIRDICDELQSKYIMGKVLPFLGEGSFNLLEKVEEALSEKETEFRRLKDALETTQ